MSQQMDMDEMEMMGPNENVTELKWYRHDMWLASNWEVRSRAFGAKPPSGHVWQRRRRESRCLCVAPSRCVQSGAYYPSVGSGLNLKTRKINYPDPGKVDTIMGVQCGGMCFTIEEDAEGVQHLSNFKALLVESEPEAFTCGAGTLTFAPGMCKMYGNAGVMWGTMSGPGIASTVPKVKKSDVVKVSQGKKLPEQSKEMEVKLPEEGEKCTGFMGRYLGANTFKTGIGTTMMEMGADGESLERVFEGQANLLKLLRVPDLEVFLEYGKAKVPQKPSNVFLNLFAQHPEINGGKKIMLFTTAPMAGPPPHILQPGVLPGNNCLKDLADLPWTHELREVLMALVKPLVDFAVALDTVALASKWKKDITNGIPKGLYLSLVKAMAKVHKQQDRDRLAYLMSCVKTRVSVVDGEWNSSGLLLKLTDAAKMMIKVSDPSVVLLHNSDESEDDSEAEELWAEHAAEVLSADDSADEDYDKAKRKRSHTSPSSSAKKGKKGKKGKKATKKRSVVAEAVDSDDNEEGLDSDEEEEE